MKKYFIVIIFLFIICSILCVEIPDSTQAKTYNVTLSLGIASGGSIGIGKIQHFEKATKEFTANFHYLMNSDYLVTGIYGQINSYRNKQRKGLFTLIMVGLDYSEGKYKPISFGGSYGTKKFEGIFPNIAIGCGYSMKLSQNNRMLIYIDLGLKKTISNLNISITF
jgi:hypothetical protein